MTKYQNQLGKKLASFDPKARAYLAEERTKFLFEGNNEMPEGYVPPKA
jgi:Fe-S cluster biosynthesis and repair protein YggX